MGTKRVDPVGAATPSRAGILRKIDSAQNTTIVHPDKHIAVPAGMQKAGSETEDGIALQFAARHKGKLRYCHDWGYWLNWDGKRWAPQRTRLAFHYARELAREANWKGAPGIARATTAAGIERFAQADPTFATTSDQWDQDPWLLATPTGTVDLRTGKIRPGNPADRITKCTAIGPLGDCPMWLRFLGEATNEIGRAHV